MTLIKQALAASDVNISGINSTASKISNQGTISTLLTGVTDFNLINFVFILVGLGFFANLVMTGWEYMLSSGDPKKVAGASSRLVNGFIGLIMVFASFLIVKLITNILGIDAVLDLN
jgi:hypothetical protein